MAINVRAGPTSEERTREQPFCYRVTRHVLYKADSLFVEWLCATLALQEELLYTYLIEDWW